MYLVVTYMIYEVQILFWKKLKPGIVMHEYNFSVLEAEAEGLL